MCSAVNTQVHIYHELQDCGVTANSSKQMSVTEIVMADAVALSSDGSITSRDDIVRPPGSTDSNSSSERIHRSKGSPRYTSGLTVDCDGEAILHSSDKEVGHQEQCNSCSPVPFNGTSKSRSTKINDNGAFVSPRCEATLESVRGILQWHPEAIDQCPRPPEIPRNALEKSRENTSLGPAIRTPDKISVLSSSRPERTGESGTGLPQRSVQYTSNLQGNSRCAGRNLTYTRRSVQIDEQRTCCVRWKTCEGKKYRVPKPLQNLPAKVTSSTQTAMLSLSAPAELGCDPAPNISAPSNSPAAELQGTQAHDLQHNNTDKDLPSYEEISRTLVHAKDTGPPPDYHDLFRAVLPEPAGVSDCRLNGSCRQVPSGQGTRTALKPVSSRNRQKRCCWGRLNDQECWILLLANGGFVLIFVLAAIFSR